MSEEWRIQSFAEFATLHRGYDLPIQDRKKGPVPIVGSNGIVGYHDKSKVKGPGVVTGRSGSIGISYYVEDDYWPLNTGLYVHDFHGNNPFYVHYFFQSFNFGKYAAGVSVPTLNRNLVHEATISVPPFPEQQKIASVLSRIQQAITVQESLIEKTRELKKSTLHYVFTRGLRGEKLKETEIGPMPENWDVVKVGKHCEKPEYGLTESAVADEIGPKFLRITDITENGVNWDTVPYCRCPQAIFPKYELKENDILFARIGATTGKSYIVKKPPQAVFASYLIRLRPSNDVIPDYLYYFFNSDEYWDQVNANKRNNLKFGVNSSILSDILFPLSSKNEQAEIARIILTIDQGMSVHTAKKLVLQDLFKTMLNKLMTGEIRVKDLDIDVSEVRA